MSLLQLSQLLPLPEDELQQVLDYAATLSRAEAADHFTNLLGESPEAIGFISAFNSKRDDGRGGGKQAGGAAGQAGNSREVPGTELAPVPKSARGLKKKKTPLHMPQPRKVGSYNIGPGTVYNKKDQETDYIASNVRPSPKPSPKPPEATPQKTSNPTSKGQQGFLISDMPGKKSKSTSSSRTSTPRPNANTSNASAPPAKWNLTGTSAAIADLDAAIRQLEVTTNPSLRDDGSARRCGCGGVRHPYQAAAPNCLSCGKVTCIKEGLGPCTNCGAPLLTAEETQAMIQELKAERGRERMALDREANRRPLVYLDPLPGQSTLATAAVSEAEGRARDLRDRLLGYQEQNARRTTIVDEEAAYDVSAVMGGPSNMWSSTEERAMELKRQQKLRREMEWNAQPEYEKRQQVVSIDLVGGKVIRKMVAKERPPTPEDDRNPDNGVMVESSGNQGQSAYNKNPMGRKVMKLGYDFVGTVEGEPRALPRWTSTRVQDLDAGIGGDMSGSAPGSFDAGSAVGDEPECG
jgi:hypothetical protein